MDVNEFMHLVREMRASQKRWPQHPEQASIETMAWEQKVDEALDGPITMNIWDKANGFDGGILSARGWNAAGDKYHDILTLEQVAVLPVTGRHWSDCAVHNEPAFPAGECNCGANAPEPGDIIKTSR